MEFGPCCASRVLCREENVLVGVCELYMVCVSRPRGDMGMSLPWKRKKCTNERRRKDRSRKTGNIREKRKKEVRKGKNQEENQNAVVITFRITGRREKRCMAKMTLCSAVVSLKSMESRSVKVWVLINFRAWDTYGVRSS